MDELLALDPSSRIDLTDLHGDESAKEISEKLYDALSKDIFFLRLRQTFLSRFLEKNSSTLMLSDDGDSKNNEDLESFEILSTVVTNIYERNKVTYMRESEASPRKLYTRVVADEKVAYIKDSRRAWEDGINEELVAMTKEQRRVFVNIRPEKQVNRLLLPNSARNENVRFLYDCDDLLETMASIRVPNSKKKTDNVIGMIKIPVATPSIAQIRKLYCYVNPMYVQLGLDDMSTQWSNRILTGRHEEAESILSSGSSLDARKFLQRGSPPSLRGALWRLALGLPRVTSSLETAKFDMLRQQCDTYDFITDELYVYDVQTVVDDPKFFVFEDELKEVALCFARDEWIRNEAQYKIHNPLTGLLDAAHFPSTTAVPPCAVQPFLGLALYHAPLCYLYRDRASLYSVSRSLYAKLWCRLNVITSDKGTLLSVCRLFETLLMMSQPRLFLHMARIGVQPLHIAFPWIHQGFVQYLEIEQVLHLWDRIIANADVNLLAVFAVAVFNWRSESLYNCETAVQATAVLQEGTRLRVIPLLQLFLFPEGAKQNV